MGIYYFIDGEYIVSIIGAKEFKNLSGAAARTGEFR